MAAQENTLNKIKDQSKTAKKTRGAKRSLPSEAEKLPYTDPSCHYQMADDMKNKLNLWKWPGDDLKDDPACQNFLPRLLDHLLGRLLGVEYDGDEKCYTSIERSTVSIMNKIIYSHRVLRVNYTTYDLRREQDTTHWPAMGKWRTLIGMHALSEFSMQMFDTWAPNPKVNYHFLWVQWFGRDSGSLRQCGWKARRLMRVGFQDGKSPGAFGFLAPALVIRSGHLEPAFALGRTDEYLLPSIARQSREDDEDWAFYYVNMSRFVDRDMFMRYRGGGVGHASKRVLQTNFFPLRRDMIELKEYTCLSMIS
ncbi:hypothetical protein APHAL10511_008357 [Amanita phalloides]|nr:hypothetical protein APHAL10511_008357 [Amanita phalloides]